MTALSIFDRLRQLLAQATNLRGQVREDLRQRQFGADDIRMHHYNQLIQVAANIVPDDPVLDGGMVLLPDPNLESYQPGRMPQDIVSLRLEGYLSQLIDRLEFILGEPAESAHAMRTARDVLNEQRTGEVQQILEAIESLSQRQEAQPLDDLTFEFITDSDLRKVLEQDFLEAQRAFAAGANKASSLLSSGLIEGMLLDKLRQPKVVSEANYDEAVSGFRRVDGEINWDRVSMTQLIQAARKLSLLREQTLGMTEGARDFRDTVHPRAEVREGLRAGREEAQLLLALVSLIHRDFARSSS